MLSKLTIAGLNTYTEGHIWDKLTLPEGVDKDTLITEIIRECSEFSVIYTDPNFLTDMIGKWSDKWYHNFSRWWTAYNFEYNALYNLDVEATYTDNGSTNTTGNSSTSNNSEVLSQKSAYSTESFKNATKDMTSNRSGSSGTSNTTNTNTRTERRFGNQGITQSQEMLQSELDVWYNNIYQMMAEVFAAEFCICIYD